MAQSTAYLNWPVDPRVTEAQAEILAEPRRARGSTAPRASLRERLVARDIVPENWLERAYEDKGPVRTKEGLIEHKAFVHLAHAPARMVAAELYAREIFSKVHFAGWVHLQHVQIIGRRADVDSDTIDTVFAIGVHPTRTVQLWMDDITCSDWPTCYAALRAQYPNREPLFEAGVIPWLVYGRGFDYYYFLSCARDFKVTTAFLNEYPDPE